MCLMMKHRDLGRVKQQFDIVVVGSTVKSLARARLVPFGVLSSVKSPVPLARLG